MMAGDAMAVVEASAEACAADWDAPACSKWAGPVDWITWAAALLFCAYLLG